MGIDDGIYKSVDGTTATSVPPTEPTPNLTGAIITDHVYAGGQYGPFSVCTYCQGHHAKHLYQSSAYVYHSPPYDPNPWWHPTYPTYPIIYGTYTTCGTGGTATTYTDGRPSTLVANVGSSISTGLTS